ncbi:TIR domain-containing protein [Micromonospora zamorensis]|uniref:AAA family ATPase n=1 Tax=Micromonospora zamorensis TaxID=709883 RepID=UPI002E222572
MEPFIVFVAYASRDGFDFACELVTWLESRDPPINASIDRDNIQNKAWDGRIEDLILGADLVLVVLTDASAAKNSYARDELRLARNWGKPIWAVRPPGSQADPPVTVQGTPIDVDSPHGGWDHLEHELRLCRPVNRTVAMLTAQVEELEERADRAQGQERKILAAMVGRLHAVIQWERRRAGNPAEAAADVRRKIDEGRHQDAAPPSRETIDGSFQIVEAPPAITSAGVHDRHSERDLLLGHLHHSRTRLVVLRGRCGSGKTALLNDLIPRLKTGGYAGVAYVSTHGPRRVTAHLLLERLARLMPDAGGRERMLERVGDHSHDWRQNLAAILDALGDISLLLIIDNAEELVADYRLTDVHLREFAHIVGSKSGHGVRVLFVSQVEIRRLAHPPVHAPQVDIPPGLPPRFAADFFRGLDEGGVARLAGVSEATMRRVHRLTHGRPRAMELLYAVLRSEPGSDLDELLTSATKAAGKGDGSQYLIRRATLALRGPMQRVLQALAVYDRPVRASAVSWLLAPYDTGLDSAAVLELLCDRRLIRRDGDLYHLPRGNEDAVTGRTVLDTIQLGSPGDRDVDPPRYTRYALWHRAAEYFRSVRELEIRVVDLNDLGAHFSEIELRLAGREYPGAAALINEVDIEHLSLWGYRSLIIRLRERLLGELGDSYFDLENRYELASAYLDASEPDKAIALLTEASAAALSPEAEDAFRVQLAKARLVKGELDAAATLYRNLLHQGNPLILGISRLGLATCLAELGMVDKALDQYAAALEVIDDTEKEAASVFLNQGLLQQQLGRPLTALQLIQRARRLAEGHSDAQLAAKCVDAMAQVHIDMGQLDRARRLADEAIKAAADAGNADLCRETYSTRALALLLGGDLVAAHDTADAATRFFENRRPFAAFALLGVTQVRLQKMESAEASFGRVQRDISPLLKPKNPAVQLLDLNGLALAGLARAEGAGNLEPAIIAYRQARKRTRAPGVVLRAVRLLDELLDGDDSPQARQTMQAAVGLDGA